MIRPTVFKIIQAKGKGILSIMAKPVPSYLEDEIAGLRELGYSRVVSLLEQTEIYDVGLSDERSCCIANGLNFMHFPIQDRGVPEIDKAIEFSAQLLNCLLKGNNVVIHCRAGIGRSGIIASAILILLGYTVSESVKMVSISRGIQIPDTEEQLAWLESFYSKIINKSKFNHNG